MKVFTEPNPTKRTMQFKPRLQFVLTVTAIALSWFVLLPKLGQSPWMRGIIERNQAASIDPTALFYSDLEHMHYERGCLRREPSLDSPAMRTGDREILARSASE